MKTAAFRTETSPFSCLSGAGMLKVAAWLMALGWCLTGMQTVRGEELKRLQYSRPLMGSMFYITLHAPDEKAAETAVEAAFARVESINAVASDYLPESELSRFNRGPMGQAVTVGADLYALLEKSEQVSSLTEGAFDVTAAYAVQQWRRARRKGRLPSPEETQKAVAMADWRNLRLEGGKRTVTKLKEGVLVDLGGIGKGYAADAALKVLREHGLPRAVVAASGDLAIGDPPPGMAGWDVALRTFEKKEEADRFEHVTLSNCGCSTSGDLHQFLELEGRRYSHIVNPRTGLGLTERIGCTVLAPDSTTADALATAFCVMGVEKTAAVVKAHPERGLRVRMTWMEGESTAFKTRELEWDQKTGAGVKDGR